MVTILTFLWLLLPTFSPVGQKLMDKAAAYEAQQIVDRWFAMDSARYTDTESEMWTPIQRVGDRYYVYDSTFRKIGIDTLRWKVVVDTVWGHDFCWLYADGRSPLWRPGRIIHIDTTYVQRYPVWLTEEEIEKLKTNLEDQ